MKKILFITSRNPFSGRYSGDVLRSNKIVYFLSKSHYVKVVSINKVDAKKKDSRLSYIGFSDINIILKIFYILKSFFQFKPLQLGYFYSPKIKEFVNNNINNFDLVIFQSFRSAQYLPENFTKDNILDMADLVSKNYEQTYRKLFLLNPMKLIYFLESKLLKNYENYCFNRFQKILLHSKKEINSIAPIYKKKIIQYAFGIDKKKKLYKYSVKNNKIIFIGNLKYVPNKKACFEFTKRILPIINQRYPEIEFHIIGEISKIDKFFLERKHNVRVFGKVENLTPHIKNVICGLANLSISSGIQTKLLTYMSYGIPTVSSKQVYENFDAIKENKINSYKNDKQMIKIILKLKNNKNFSLNSSKISYKNIQKLEWKKVLKFLNKI